MQKSRAATFDAGHRADCQVNGDAGQNLLGQYDAPRFDEL